MHRIKNRLAKLRLQPIRVFCFHHVSKEYNPLTMWKCDWMQIDEFKRHVKRMQEHGYSFIPLDDAFKKLRGDFFRIRKYAVLTFDDGYASLKEILPWLEENHIPVTLFINTRYLDGKSWSAINEEQARRVKADVDMLTEVCPDLYLSHEELSGLNSPYITIGVHGHEHLDARQLSSVEFHKNVEQCRSVLKQHPRYIPYMAYTWGRYTSATNEELYKMGLIPVLVNGTMNYSYESKGIDRECIK